MTTTNDSDVVVLGPIGDVGSVAVTRNDVDRLVTIEGHGFDGVTEVTLTPTGVALVVEALQRIREEWREEAVNPARCQCALWDGRLHGQHHHDCRSKDDFR